MSFKVGDYVLTDIDSHVYKIVSIDGFVVVLSGSWWGHRLISNNLSRSLRHATPEEIAAGHRIDHVGESTEKVELSGNSEELEVLEMIDVSPNCEVSEL